MGLEALIIGAVAGIAGAGIAKAVSHGGDKAGPAPTPQSLPEAPTSTSAAEDAQASVNKRRVSATKTVFTDPLGISGQADVVRKTLTGQ